jgi:hypothetical protein
MSEEKPETQDETYQEGVTPVQVFCTGLIPGDAEKAKTRRGRPGDVSPAVPPATSPSTESPTS